MNNGQQAFRRVVTQIRASGGGKGPGKGAFAGGGLIAVLAGGAFLVNASLFNGMSRIFVAVTHLTSLQSMVDIEQSNTAGV